MHTNLSRQTRQFRKNLIVVHQKTHEGTQFAKFKQNRKKLRTSRRPRRSLSKGSPAQGLRRRVDNSEYEGDVETGVEGLQQRLRTSDASLENYFKLLQDYSYGHEHPLINIKNIIVLNN